MSKPHRNTRSVPLDDPLFTVKQRKAVPHEFVLEAIAAMSPQTRPMFGCLAVYVGDKIVLILRDKRDKTADNGVWLATTEEHHESLRREFPNMRAELLLGTASTMIKRSSHLASIHWSGTKSRTNPSSDSEFGHARAPERV